jgi:single-strand DNA-binding protein
MRKGENMSINRVVISGNLTRDPELRSTASGFSVLHMGVAVNDRRKNQTTGEWEDYPNFIDCTLFGPRAENIARWISKGSKVAIEGKLRWSQWDAKDGTKRSKVEVIVDEIEFLNRRDSGDTGAGAGSFAAGGADSSLPPVSDADIPPVPEITVYDDDIPF